MQCWPVSGLKLQLVVRAAGMCAPVTGPGVVQNELEDA